MNTSRLQTDYKTDFRRLARSGRNAIVVTESVESRLSDCALFHIWKRFDKEQRAIRTSLGTRCKPPDSASGQPAELISLFVSRLQQISSDRHPRNNLAHCFSCGENFNNIDLMMIQGHDFLPAVEILRSWLDEYRRDLGRSNAGAESNTSRRSVAE